MFNYHQSKLFEKAINQPIISNYRKKRRESVPLIVNKKGSASKHAYFTSDQKQLNIKDPKPRLTKSMNFPTSSSTSSILKMKASQLHQSKWDPHIDQLDILYAKMNGIAALSTSPPLPHSTLSTNSSIISIAHSTSTSSQFNNDGFQYSIQAVSPTTTHFSFDDFNTTVVTNNNQDYYNSNNNNDNSNNNNIDFSLLKKIEEYNDDDNSNNVNNDHTYNMEDELYTTKALLTMILSITNQLIQARFDYLSEEMFNLNDENKEEKKFMMHFLSTCIQQAECLEQLISSQLKSKRTLNQYLHHHININDEDEEKEKEKELIQWYHDHIHQCIQLYEQQLFMTDTLQDILKEFEQENLELVVDINDHHHQHNQYNDAAINNNDENNDCYNRWDFQQPIDQLLGFEDMNDRLSSLKYQVGMFIGEGLGTGHLIHSSKKKKSKVIKKKKSKKNDLSPSIEKSNHIKSVNHHHHHHQKDNIDNQIQPIYYLSRLQWVKDELISECQYHQCKNKFSFFLRKHHCRRCGQIICYEHSTHQLPLYKKLEKDDSSSSPYLLCWSRVCDHCYISYS